MERTLFYWPAEHHDAFRSILLLSPILLERAAWGCVRSIEEPACDRGLGGPGRCPACLPRGGGAGCVVLLCGPVYIDGESALCDLRDQDLKPNVDSAPALPPVSMHQSENPD